MLNLAYYVDNTRFSVKELIWLGSSLDDLKSFPADVQDEIGYALHYAQMGSTYSSVKIFKGHGSGVYEIVSNYNTDAYRAIYVVNLDECLYVLHAFQKKSKSGIKTPKTDLNVMETRLKQLKVLLKKGAI
jgi:phage-related protein